ncbi:MAG: hypothetical protein AB1631_27520, partial [Acidobacteriota bacterium]
MLFKKYRVGMDVNAWCGKCKLERVHVIAAMDGDDIMKVTCSTCAGTHKYKSSEPKTRASGKAGSTRGRKTDAYNIDPARPVKSYSMQSNFSEGDVINHPKFGLGSVQTSMPPNKIEVRFQEGT